MVKYFSTKQTSELMNDSYKDNLSNEIRDIVSNKKTWNQGLDTLLDRTNEIKERGYASETDKFALNTLKSALKNDRYLNSERVANASEVSGKQKKLYKEIDNVLAKYDTHGNYGDFSNTDKNIAKELDSAESEKLGVKEAYYPEKKGISGWGKAAAAGLIAFAGITGYFMNNPDHGAGRPAYALPTSGVSEERIETDKKKEAAPVKEEYTKEKAEEDYDGNKPDNII
ncbi:hypothetical protein GF336_07235, partial [Candidatus Woesearchaeota archaeon]|nr:hypothetical protein [Candidatus Woesearchaeota archaeon]